KLRKKGRAAVPLPPRYADRVRTIRHGRGSTAVAPPPPVGRVGIRMVPFRELVHRNEEVVAVPEGSPTEVAVEAPPAGGGPEVRNGAGGAVPPAARARGRLRPRRLLLLAVPLLLALGAGGVFGYR